jgi:hypothetical protein
MGLFRLSTFSFLSLVVLMVLVGRPAHAQITIWSDNFNNGCTNDCIANTWGGWTIQDNVGGTTGGAPNNWFVSCAEEGIAPPGCGSSCIGDASLHIGANPGAGGDMGASFNETGATNATFRRVVSPTINTTGYSTNTLQFDFIAYGSAACSDDRAQLHLSTDNGATWPVGFQYCLNSVCCGACNGYSQGQWTLYTLALPAAFDNNPNVRVAFHWRNNGNGSGTDPSVAIDDVRITTVVAPVELTYFNARMEGGQGKLNWSTAMERNFSHFEVEKSLNGTDYSFVQKVSASSALKEDENHYMLLDPTKLQGTTYYRLKMVDLNGATALSHVVRVKPDASEALEIAGLDTDRENGKITAQLWAVEDMTARLEVVDMQGKVLYGLNSVRLRAGENTWQVDGEAFTSGVYFLRFTSSDVPQGYQPVKVTRKFVLF